MKTDEVFAEAVKIGDAQGRKQYLDAACAGNPQLRARVDALLAAHGKAASFLEAPAGELPDEAFPGTETFAPRRSISEGPGTVVGRYKLQQQIGEGGMGVVYMAEQEKPVRRRVALKIIKPGMDSAQVIARFEAERQALAMMDHPNIARVLDAGCTETGRPYFVMELVQGIPITKYCDDKQLDTHERLELFMQVCNAVQHAHQKGIIHRDLKPSNVLVMIYDGKPVPKIIDFGVAKALHQRLTEATMFTQFGAVVGTLEYMSPEQAEMDALGTDTRSDIYSLGVLLYELLAGSTPLDGKKLRSLGYAEMLKTIREVDPPRPSTRLTQSALTATDISAKRHTEPRRLQKMIAGDLDWIVMKCLEKDRTRRYETANGLAMDIQRHLHDEAVLASPPGSVYKFQKLVRRNKLVFGAVGCVTLALVIGLTASLWQAGRASREATRAKAALDDLRGAAPSMAAEARMLAAREKLDEAIGKLDYAIKLRPDVPDYLLTKADLLETQMRFPDAAAAYRAVLKLRPDDARAKANADLCERVAAAPKTSEGKLTRESLSILNEQMLKDQRPAAEIMPIARLLGDEKKYIVSYWLDRLKDLPNGTDKPLDKRLTVRDDGLLELDISGMKIADLAPLAGMPLGTLNIRDCPNITDLSPLRGMPLTQANLAQVGVTSLEPLRGMNALRKLSITQLKVADLAPLSGLRLNYLAIEDCDVSNLTPLHGMPLETLILAYTPVSNLSPLVGMPLKELVLGSVLVTDFTPLTNLPLESCYFYRLSVGDLAFLRGVPLKKLGLVGASVRSLTALSDIRSLKVLALPDLSGASEETFAAVEALRNHPSIEQVSDRFSSLVLSPDSLAAIGPFFEELLEKTPSKDEFWKNWDRDHAWALRLRKAGVAFSRGRTADGTWNVQCNDKRFSDPSLFAGAAITSLDLTGTSVEDLAALRGMKLEQLSLYGTRVHDLSPLQGMPLKALGVHCDQLTDVSPLVGIPTLEQLVLPIHAADLEPLRKLPNLKGLSFTYVLKDSNWTACTAEVFWKTWDGLPWVRKLESAGIAFQIEQMEDGFYSAAIHDPKFTDCSIFKGSNVRRLELQRTGVVDLNVLADLPLQALDIRETSAADLSPLQSQTLRSSLRELRIWKTRVTDLSPIAGCTGLQLLDAANVPLKDLSVLKGLKLQTLLIGGTDVTDLSLLVGMPLVNLNLGGTPVKDLSPLLKCTTLKSLVLPQGAENVESLRALTNLERLSYSLTVDGDDADKTADAFWKAYMPAQPWARKLTAAGIPYSGTKLTGGFYEVGVHDPKFADCSIFTGSNVRRLDLQGSSAADLRPLADLPLQTLDVRETPVADLSPLRSPVLATALRDIRLWKTRVTDFSPVAACVNLQLFDAADTPITDLSVLKGMKLRTLLLARAPVSDVSVVAGMPLEWLDLEGTKVTDVALLAQCPTLKKLTIPRESKNVEALRALRNLTQLSYTEKLGGDPDKTAAQFWAEYDRTHGAPATSRE